MTNRVGLYIIHMIIEYGELMNRLRGSEKASTRKPDLDNANVGTNENNSVECNGISGFFFLHRQVEFRRIIE